LKKRNRRNSSIKNLRFAQPSRLDVPNSLELIIRVRREGRVLSGDLPGLSEIGGSTDLAAEPGIVHNCEDRAGANIIDRMVNLTPCMERSRKLSAGSIRAGEQKQALFHAHHQHNVYSQKFGAKRNEIAVISDYFR
jgi:hypothetical protein